MRRRPLCRATADRLANGKRRALFFTRKGLTAVDPASGKIEFEYPWHPAEFASVSTATPLVIDDMIFLSACYGTGAILLRDKNDSVEKVWSADKVLSHAIARAEALGMPYEQGRALLERGRRADVARAATIFAELGAEHDRARAEALL